MSILNRIVLPPVYQKIITRNVFWGMRKQGGFSVTRFDYNGA